jgi:ADP-ribosylglycohydrolase
MVLFTVEALVTPGDTLHAAYLRWLRTQETPTPPPGATGLAAQQWLYDTRAPGNACLSGLRTGSPDPNPNSKGCGTVMRSAPFGLASSTPEAAAGAAIAGSVLTHGHPTAGVSAAGLAVLIHHIMRGVPLTDAVQRTIDHLASLDGHEETTVALRRAGGGEIADHGEGWVAEEALAMSVHCALVHPGPAEMREALLLAVNHSGDSDSTGAITGNILGALHGEGAIPVAWAADVEGREILLELADRLLSRP